MKYKQREKEITTETDTYIDKEKNIQRDRHR